MTDLGRYVWKRERVRVSSPAGLPVPLRHPKADPRGAEFGEGGGEGGTSFFGSSFFFPAVHGKVRYISFPRPAAAGGARRRGCGGPSWLGRGGVIWCCN